MFTTVTFLNNFSRQDIIIFEKNNRWHLLYSILTCLQLAKQEKSCQKMIAVLMKFRLVG